jgi:hypothetical protein
MFITNGIDAILIKNNRGTSGFYDDQDKIQEEVVVCPYNVDQDVKFGTYTVPEATGYYMLKNTVDVREGDQLIFNGRTYSILRVKDNWIWNKIVNFTVAVK